MENCSPKHSCADTNRISSSASSKKQNKQDKQEKPEKGTLQFDDRLAVFILVCVVLLFVLVVGACVRNCTRAASSDPREEILDPKNPWWPGVSPKVVGAENFANVNTQNR